MKLRVRDQIKKGSRIPYDDGRPGHQGVEGTVLEVDADGMLGLFDDRADTNYIRFLDSKWMEFIGVIE